MKKSLFLVMLLCCGLRHFVAAQYDLLPDDSLKHLLGGPFRSPSPERTMVGLEYLGRMLPGNPGFDSLRDVIISEAEGSRNRQQMCSVYLGVARIYLFYDIYDYKLKAQEYINRAFDIAAESGLDLYQVSALIERSRFFLSMSQPKAALDCNNKALAIASGLKSDSLLAVAYTALAYTWDAFANKLSRFQALLTARTAAGRSGEHKLVLRNGIDLATFYANADQQEKCKDFYVQAIDKGREWGEWNFVIEAQRGLAKIYGHQGQATLALATFDSALMLANKHDLRQVKTGITLDLLNFYFNYVSPEKGLAYLDSHPEIMQFLKDIHITYELNKLYAALNEEHGRHDSALYYLNIAAPFEYARRQAYQEKFYFTNQMATVLENAGKKEEAMRRLLLAAAFADSSDDLENLRDINQKLDSGYQALGDYKKAFAAYSRYNFYKDSLETLGRQKDLLNAEIEDAGKRAEEQKAEDAARLRTRDNLQYLGMTAAIAMIFIVLVVFGVFKMSPSIIKALGFFAFIFLFEFITLLLDKQIHELTHGEPWKVLAIKIVLIAMLLPLHHALEHRVFHFLTSKAHRLKENFKLFGGAKHQQPPIDRMT